MKIEIHNIFLQDEQTFTLTHDNFFDFNKLTIRVGRPGTFHFVRKDRKYSLIFSTHFLLFFINEDDEITNIYL